jgi:hypothetical protein
MAEPKKLLAIDIDMTLADNLARLRICVGADNRIDYARFFQSELVLGDSVIPGSRQALELLRTRYELCFLSARPVNIESLSEQWLYSHKLRSVEEKVVHVGNSSAKVAWILNQQNFACLIDDCKYDYQSGKPKLNEDILKQLDARDIPYVIFQGEWSDVCKTLLSA